MNTRGNIVGTRGSTPQKSISTVNYTELASYIT